MEEIEIAFQSWTGKNDPKRISLEIPGWGGIAKNFSTAKPWQCKPFVDGNTAGFEVSWPIDCEILIESEDGVKANISDTWSEITKNESSVSQFADGHIGINTNFRFKFPKGWSGLIMPHPKWFADPYSTNLPFVIPGMLEFDWWHRYFFLVLRCPPPGKKIMIRPNEPFFQVIPFKRHRFSLRSMNESESQESNEQDALITKHYSDISSHNWQTKDGKKFGNIYKVLSAEFKKNGKIDWTAIKEKFK
jgi:hypothetical protein